MEKKCLAYYKRASYQIHTIELLLMCLLKIKTCLLKTYIKKFPLSNCRQYFEGKKDKL